MGVCEGMRCIIQMGSSGLKMSLLDTFIVSALLENSVCIMVRNRRYYLHNLFQITTNMHKLIED